MFQPTTDVRILKNVNCDATQQNVLSFSSESAQTSYYMGCTKHHFDTCRVEGTESSFGRIILPGTPADYYDCNYIMWRNPQFSGKWFYAYMNNVRPLNSGACVADYMFDHFRTWYFELSLGPCLVAREHVNSDSPGEWLLPEDIETGEFLLAPDTGNEVDLMRRGGVDWSAKLVIVYTYSPDTGGDGFAYFVNEVSQGLSYRFQGLKPVFAGGYMESGIFQGCRYLAFNMSESSIEENIERVNSYIRLLVGEGQINKIQAMFMCPGWLASHALAIPVNTVNPVSMTVSGNAMPTSFGSYTPRNKKLLTQQFNYMVLSNNMGSVLDLGYEYFTGTPSFKVYGALSQNPQLMIYPMNYKNSNGENHQFGIELSGFPRSSFSYSQFNQDMGANAWSEKVSQVSDVYGGISGMVKGIGGAVAAPSFGSVTGAVDSVANAALGAASQVASYHDKRRVPNTLSGTADGNIVWSMGRMTYSLYQMQISADYAKKVDSYFDMYGYRIDTYKRPNTSGRRNWNYVQAIDPVIQGNLPAESKLEIYNIFSRGVRIWHNPDTWMNYTADNSIV